MCLLIDATFYEDTTLNFTDIFPTVMLKSTIRKVRIEMIL